ncbi:MAG: hypothetical protein ACR2PL_13025 [Dehalococcoidia bacterium]
MASAGQAQTREGFQELSTEKGWALLDERAQRYVRVGARDFVSRWDAGQIDNPDRPEVLRVAMLLPFVR